MKKINFRILFYGLLAFCFASCTDAPVDHEQNEIENEQIELPSVTEDIIEIVPEQPSEPKNENTEDVSVPEVPAEEVPEQPVNTEAKGGSDYSFSRHYVDEVYDIHIVSEIVGREARDEWVNNVFLKLSPEEQNATPNLYLAIEALGVTKEALIAQNKKDEYHPLPDYIIEALYMEDKEDMKKALTSPLALYHNGVVYTFDMLAASGDFADAIPKDILTAYFDKIQAYCEEEKLIKYMQEEIDNAKLLNGINE